MFTQYCAGDKIENEMGGADSLNRGVERRVQGFGGGNLRKRDHWGEPVVDGRIISSQVITKWDVGIWSGMSWLRIQTVGRYLRMR
jgi:hypothetical protein